jgi:hypothetical protein
MVDLSKESSSLVKRNNLCFLNFLEYIRLLYQNTALYSYFEDISDYARYCQSEGTGARSYKHAYTSLDHPANIAHWDFSQLKS